MENGWWLGIYLEIGGEPKKDLTTMQYIHFAGHASFFMHA